MPNRINQSACGNHSVGCQICSVFVFEKASYTLKHVCCIRKYAGGNFLFWTKGSQSFCNNQYFLENLCKGPPKGATDSVTVADNSLLAFLGSEVAHTVTSVTYPGGSSNARHHKRQLDAWRQKLGHGPGKMPDKWENDPRTKCARYSSNI